MIGAENPYEVVRDCSFVAAKYTLGDRLSGATVGRLGSTTVMAYHHAFPAVDYIASSLSGLLARLRSS